MQKYLGQTYGLGDNDTGYPALNSMPITPPTLITIRRESHEQGAYWAAEEGYLPKPAPTGWFLFSSDSVKRGETITVESNLRWNTSRPLVVSGSSRAIKAGFISPQKIVLKIPTDWPHDFLVSTKGNNGHLVFRGVAAAAGAGAAESNIVLHTLVRPSAIRVTGNTTLATRSSTRSRR